MEITLEKSQIEKLSKWEKNILLVRLNYSLFVCLFVWDLTTHSRFVHTYWDVNIAGEGLQILTYARHAWSLRSEGSLTCDICLPNTRNNHTCCRAVTTCFNDLGLLRPGIEPRSPAYKASGVRINNSVIYSQKKQHGVETLYTFLC